jgi:hypothetical protein
MEPDVLTLHSPHGWLRVFCRMVAPDKVRVPGVQHLRYAVGGHGFSGAGDGFVNDDDLRIFCVDLLALVEGQQERTARLRADPSRGGLTVEIGPGPDPDTLAVAGNIAVVHFRTLTEADGLYQWRTEFGFSIRRDALPNLRGVNWVSSHAV